MDSWTSQLLFSCDETAASTKKINRKLGKCCQRDLLTLQQLRFYQSAVEFSHQNKLLRARRKRCVFLLCKVYRMEAFSQEEVRLAKLFVHRK